MQKFQTRFNSLSLSLSRHKLLAEKLFGKQKCDNSFIRSLRVTYLTRKLERTRENSALTGSPGVSCDISLIGIAKNVTIVGDKLCFFLFLSFVLSFRQHRIIVKSLEKKNLYDARTRLHFTIRYLCGKCECK